MKLRTNIMPQACFGSPQARFWRGLGVLGPVFGATWPLLGTFWALLGASALSLGLLLGASRCSWPHLGSLGCLCARFLKGLGRLLAGFWRALGQFSLPFSKAMRSLLQGSQHGIPIGISLPPCSAAVRAQHMESYRFKTMVQDGLQEALWMAFGSIWEGFGEDLDASWENLGIQN